MALTFKVEIVDGVSEALATARTALAGVNLNPVLARSATNKTRSHLFALDASRANTMGGARTHFYGQCARGTGSGILPDGFFVSINQVGYRQRLEGGTIRPRASKMLTIPARAEAYGKRALEFNNLRVAMFKSGAMALVTTPRTGGYAKASKKGVKLSKAAKMPGLVMYWLVRSVYQGPDPSVMPSESDYQQTMRDASTEYVGMLQERFNKGGGA